MRSVQSCIRLPTDGLISIHSHSICSRGLFHGPSVDKKTLEVLQAVANQLLQYPFKPDIWTSSLSNFKAQYYIIQCWHQTLMTQSSYWMKSSLTKSNTIWKCIKSPASKIMRHKQYLQEDTVEPLKKGSYILDQKGGKKQVVLTINLSSSRYQPLLLI